MELALRGDGTISGAKLISDNIVGTAEIDAGSDHNSETSK